MLEEFERIADIGIIHKMREAVLPIGLSILKLSKMSPEDPDITEGKRQKYSGLLIK